MSIYWSGDTRKHESYARKRYYRPEDDSAPGLAIVLALIAGGIGASIVILIGGWFIARLVG